MQLAPAGRFVTVAQWVLAVLLPLWIAVGRALVGAQLGWMALFGIFVGPVLVVMLLVPPIVALFDTVARRAGGVRQAYAIAMYVVWAALLLAGLAVVDVGDDGPGTSSLTRWFGMSTDASQLLFLALLAVALLAWVGAIVAAGFGIAWSRRATRAASAPA